MFNPQDDPLGLGLQSRARAHRWADSIANPMSQTLGPLPDPMWDSYFQAVAEAANGKQVKFGQESPVSNDSMNDPEVYANNQRVLGFEQQNAPSRQLGTAGIPPALLALQRRQGRK